MSILAHNLYRLLAEDLPGFTHHTAATLFDKFMINSGKVHIADDTVTVVMKKKRNIPAPLTALEKFQNKPIAWMQDRKFSVVVDSTSCRLKFRGYFQTMKIRAQCRFAVRGGSYCGRLRSAMHREKCWVVDGSCLSIESSVVFVEFVVFGNSHRCG